MKKEKKKKNSGDDDDVCVCVRAFHLVARPLESKHWCLREKLLRDFLFNSKRRRRRRRRRRRLRSPSSVRRSQRNSKKADTLGTRVTRRNIGSGDYVRYAAYTKGMCSDWLVDTSKGLCVCALSKLDDRFASLRFASSRSLERVGHIKGWTAAAAAAVGRGRDGEIQQ